MTNDFLNKYKSQNAVDMLKEYSEKGGSISFVQPVSNECLSNFEEHIAVLPKDLKEVYCFTNGFFSDMVDLLPIFDKNNVKRTWDSIERANSDRTTFDFPIDWMKDFCIFARFNATFAMAFNKLDHTLWLEYPDGTLHEKQTSLRDFILVGLESY